MIEKALERMCKARAEKPALYHLFIIGLFVLLTAVLTYPVIVNLAGSIAGSGDAWQALYILWYTKHALLAGNANLTMSYTNYLFYPAGVPMILSSFSLFDQLLAVPMQMLIGLVPTFNVLWLLSFILAGYGMFLLARYLTGNDAAAFVSGIVFAFCPYHFAHALGHLGATTIEWIPFCALFLIMMYREGGIKNAFLAGVFFIMVVISDSQYMMYMFFFAGLLFLYELAHACFLGGADRPGMLKKILAMTVVFACVALAVVIPLNYDLICISTSADNFLKPDIQESIMFSADLLSFITPSALHPFFGGLAFDTNDIAEYTTYAGLTVLALSAVALVCRRKERVVWFWGISALFFAVMALGPELHVMGTLVWPIVTLPYMLVYNLVPFMSNSRDVSRFDVMVMLSLAVLAGYGLSSLMDRLGSLSIRRLRPPAIGLAIACIAAALIVFEFLSVPTVSQVDTPAIYESIGQDSGQYAILEIPASSNYACGIKTEYYNTIDGKQMVGGQLPRVPDSASDFEKNTPLINDLTYLSFVGYPGTDIFNQDVTAIGNYVLDYYNIGYVILHKDFMDTGTLESDEFLLNETLKSGPVYEDENLVAYRVENASPELFMVAGSGWYNSEYDEGSALRWTDNNATIGIISPGDGRYVLSFDALSFMPITLDVSMNNETLASWPMTNQIQHVTVQVAVRAGQNTVMFSSPDWSEPPSGQYPTFMFENISMEPAGIS